jgi:hypothetical protein
MEQFYKKHVEKFHYLGGEKYIHESIFRERVGNLLDTIESSQKRYIDSENLLLEISNNKFLWFFFGKRIAKHLEKYKNHKLKF